MLNLDKVSSLALDKICEWCLISQHYYKISQTSITRLKVFFNLLYFDLEGLLSKIL